MAIPTAIRSGDSILVQYEYGARSAHTYEDAKLYRWALHLLLRWRAELGTQNIGTLALEEFREAMRGSSFETAQLSLYGATHQLTIYAGRPSNAWHIASLSWDEAERFCNQLWLLWARHPLPAVTGPSCAATDP